MSNQKCRAWKESIYHEPCQGHGIVDKSTRDSNAESREETRVSFVRRAGAFRILGGKTNHVIPQAYHSILAGKAYSTNVNHSFVGEYIAGISLNLLGEQQYPPKEPRSSTSAIYIRKPWHSPFSFLPLSLPLD